MSVAWDTQMTSRLIDGIVVPKSLKIFSNDGAIFHIMKMPTWSMKNPTTVR